jgi:hypothetical protein
MFHVEQICFPIKGSHLDMPQQEVSSLRDLGEDGRCSVRKLKLTVNKVSSLRDLQYKVRDPYPRIVLCNTRGDA